MARGSDCALGEMVRGVLQADGEPILEVILAGREQLIPDSLRIALSDE